MVSFLIGMMVGAIFAIFTMALFKANDPLDDYDYERTNNDDDGEYGVTSDPVNYENYHFYE